MIPKIIHYCWFGQSQLTELELKCIDSWNKHLPDFVFKRWDESNFDYCLFGFSYDAYRCKKYAFVSDVCRLYALYHEGGIYLDTDMLVLKDFSPFLENSFFLGEEKEGVLNAAILGCEAGNEIVESLLCGYVDLGFSPESPTSIPVYLSSILDRNTVKVYPKEYFYPLPYKERGKNFQSFITPNSFAVHLWNHSWKDYWDYLHDKNFNRSFLEFFDQVKLRGFTVKDRNFVVAFLKFLFAAKFPGFYNRFKRFKG